MSDKISNQNSISDGPLGAVQLSDGSGQLTGSSKLYFDSQAGVLYVNGAPVGSGGGSASNVISGTPGQIAYYVNGVKVGGDPGFTYNNINQSVTISGDLIVRGNTYTTNNAVFDDTIIHIGNAAPAFTTLGVVMSRPEGNVMMAYLSTEDGGAYMNTLTFGYTFGSPSETLLPPDTSNNLEVRIFGNVTANYYSGNASQLTWTTSATPDTYGSSSAVPVITVDSNGRISSITTSSVAKTLQEVVNNGNTTSNTVQFTNAFTAFVTSANVGIANSNPLNLLSIGTNTYVSSFGVGTSGFVSGGNLYGNIVGSNALVGTL
jgi:hypothetical protein